MHGTVDTVAVVGLQVAQQDVKQVGPILREIIMGNLGNDVGTDDSDLGFGICETCNNDFTNSSFTLEEGMNRQFIWALLSINLTSGDASGPTNLSSCLGDQ